MEGVEDTDLKCRLIKVTMENCSHIHFDSLSLGVNAIAYYAKICSFLSLSRAREGRAGGGGGGASKFKSTLSIFIYEVVTLSLSLQTAQREGYGISCLTH